MERKLNDQWVEELDGKMHMLKAVEPIIKFNCKGCRFFSGFGMANACCRLNDCDEYASVDSDEFLGCGYGNTFIIKDLGILNEDGCLPCPFCGEYPTLREEMDENDVRIYAVEHECNINITTGWNHDKQTVIDAWNRRA